MRVFRQNIRNCSHLSFFWSQVCFLRWFYTRSPSTFMTFVKEKKLRTGTGFSLNSRGLIFFTQLQIHLSIVNFKLSCNCNAAFIRNFFDNFQFLRALQLAWVCLEELRKNIGERLLHINLSQMSRLSEATRLLWFYIFTESIFGVQIK